MSTDIDSYYFSFQATGCAEVDEILRSVARAGKSSHHTDGWGDDDYGPSKVSYIQGAANAAAAEITSLRARLAEAEGNTINNCVKIIEREMRYFTPYGQDAAKRIIHCLRPLPAAPSGKGGE